MKIFYQPQKKTTSTPFNFLFGFRRDIKDLFNGSIFFVLACITMDGSKYIGFGPCLVMIHSCIQFFAGLMDVLNPFLFPTLPRFHSKAVAA